MLRDQWKFRYTARQLAEAAQTKIEFHKGRLEFWEARRKEVIGQIKADGIEVNEKSVLLQYASPKMRDFQEGGDIMIRNDLRKRLAESYEKLAYHTGRRDTFDGWQQVLGANPDDKIELDIDDWLFFFGRDTSKDGQ
ncbi:MAG: hypothetical protein NTW41_12375 [Verrucomicrobia bacterium]|jgi:hypothetical protein|nr:hypothetical protein [Verrucomicrobiota bacterium]